MPPVKDVSQLLDLGISCLNYLVRRGIMHAQVVYLQFIYNNATSGSDDFDEELREKEKADWDAYLSDQDKAFKQFILENVPCYAKHMHSKMLYSMDLILGKFSSNA